MHVVTQDMRQVQAVNSRGFLDLKRGRDQEVDARKSRRRRVRFSPVQFHARSIASAPFDIGSATFRIVQGSGAVVPYASVIDNSTADAAFVLGRFPDNAAVGESGAPPSVFRNLFDLLKVSY